MFWKKKQRIEAINMVPSGRILELIRVEDMSIAEHVLAAHAHIQKAQSLAYADEPQPYNVRIRLNRVQSLLITMITNKELVQRAED